MCIIVYIIYKWAIFQSYMFYYWRVFAGVFVGVCYLYIYIITGSRLTLGLLRLLCVEHTSW